MSTWSPATLHTFTTALRGGQVCAAPAEGVYGYVADPFNLTALQTLLESKNRAPTKGYIVLISNLSQLSLLCPSLPEVCQSAITEHWQPRQPATTLVLPALPTLPSLLTGGLPTIAVRLPNPAYMQEYLAATAQPIVSTSLNLSGQPPATMAEQLPPNIPALTLPQPLSGTPSRIYNPQTNIFLR